MKTNFCIILLSCLALFISSCGTILKPNQVGKRHSSQLDVTIVLLDAIGLLFFVIPGVVAFIVDYSNGTLYLPRGGGIKLEDTSDEGIQKALSINGYSVSVDQIKSAASK